MDTLKTIQNNSLNLLKFILKKAKDRLEQRKDISYALSLKGFSKVRFSGRDTLRVVKHKILSYLCIPSFPSLVFIIFLWIVLEVGFIYILPVFIQTVSNLVGVLLPNLYTSLNSFVLPDFFMKLTSSEDIRAQYQNLIAILQIIATIIFSLFIFIAESSGQKDKYEYPDKPRILLANSEIWIVTTILFTSLFSYSYIKFAYSFGNSFYFVIPMFFTIGMICYSLIKIIRLLIDRNELKEQVVNSIKNKLPNYLKDLTQERVLNNSFYSIFLNPNILLKLSFGKKDENEYYVFSSTKYGYVSDINIRLLNRLGRELEAIAQKNGYSFHPSQELSTKYSSEIVEYIPKKVNNHRYIKINIHQNITPDNNAILFISKAIFTETDYSANKNKINKLLQNIIKVEKVNKRIKDKGIQDDLTWLENSAIDAIKEGKREELSNTSQLYIDIVDSFLVFIKRNFGNYNLKSSSNEFTIGGGWEIIDKISESLRLILDEGVRSKNSNVLTETMYIPMRVLIKSIEFLDSYVFTMFIGFSELIYSYSQKIEEREIKKLLNDRAFRYVKEIADYRLTEHLEGTYKASALDLAKLIIRNAKNLLEDAYRYNDYDSFKFFIENLDDMFKFYIEDFYLHNFHTKDHPNFEVARELYECKQTVYFGLTAMILDLRKEEKSKKYYDLLVSYLPNKLDELTNVFLNSYTLPSEDFWKWDNWDMKEQSGMISIRTREKMQAFYTIHSLNILASNPSLDISKVELLKDKDNREFVFTIEGPIFQLLQSLQANSKDFSSYLNSDAVSQIEKLKNAFQKAIDHQDALDSEKLKVKDLSQEKIQKFEKDVLENFNRSFKFRKVLKKHGTIIITEKVGGLKRYGVNQITAKEAFFDNWHSSYIGVGENFGEAVGIGIDTNIVKIIHQASEKYELNMIEELTSKKYKNLFILAVNVGEYELSRKLKGFEPDYLDEYICGIYSPTSNIKIPVYRIHTRDKIGGVILCKTKNIGELTIVKDITSNNELEINVIKYDPKQKDFELLLKKSPSWLKKKGSRQEQEEYLKAHVITQVLVRYRFKLRSGKYFFFKIKDWE